MVRALYAEYTGPLYELHRISDNTTKQIGVKPGTGFADAGAQTAFCPPSTKVRLRSTDVPAPIISKIAIIYISGLCEIVRTLPLFLCSAISRRFSTSRGATTT